LFRALGDIAFLAAIGDVSPANDDRNLAMALAVSETKEKCARRRARPGDDADWSASGPRMTVTGTRGQG
jgi:hypothetical protein